MTAQPCFSLFDGPDAARGPVARMLMLSLALHLGLLAVVLSVRFSPKIPDSLASYQVSLVTLPVPAPAAQPVPPAEAARPPAPTPAVKPRPTREAAAVPQEPVRARPALASKPAPPVMPAPRVSTRPRAPIATPTLAAPAAGQVPRRPTPADDLGDLLQGLQAPAAPKLQEMRAAPTVSPVVKARKPEAASPLEKTMEAILNRAQVPDVRVPAPAKPVPPSPTNPRPSLVDEISARLETPQPAVTPAKPAVAAKPPLVKRPDTALQVPGADKAPSRYLALIQNLISARWTAPPVDLSGQPLQVVIKFRLDRSGNVTTVVVEKTSGNGYYDDAGLRAVKAAGPLPPFPADLTELYFDVHFSFTVGEQAG